MELNNWRNHARTVLRSGDPAEVTRAIEAGHELLALTGRLPMAVALDSALALAELHLIGHQQNSPRWDHVGWAVTLASYAADRAADNTPGAVACLTARAAALLRCCEHVAPGTINAERLARANAQTDRASAFYAGALDQAAAERAALTAVLSVADPLLVADPEVRRVIEEQVAGARLAARQAAEPGLAEALIFYRVED